MKLTRAAVKFTYEITNKSSRDYWLSVIRIDKSASHEYLLPNGMTYDDAENVTDFQVPAAKYTPFNQLYKENKKLTAKSTEPVKLPSFYLSEGSMRMPMTHIQIIRMAIIIRLPTRPLLRWIQRIIVVRC